ncbi:hypothetical protein BT93_E2363 [Corymbia citriodora subsp. variegata]|nr:hypothetical protein BT93_E2363 [Corymbia citriodora subsp. variegata]
MQIAIDWLDFEFDSYECVHEFVRVTLNEVFLCKFCLWMLGGEFIGNRHYTLQNQQQSLLQGIAFLSFF